MYSCRIVLKTGIWQNDDKKCPVLSSLYLVFSVQDAFRHGRVQVLFQRYFLAQSGNEEYVMTRRGAGCEVWLLPLRYGTCLFLAAHVLHVPAEREWVWRALKWLLGTWWSSQKAQCTQKGAQGAHWPSVGLGRRCTCNFKYGLTKACQEQYSCEQVSGSWIHMSLEVECKKALFWGFS